MPSGAPLFVVPLLLVLALAIGMSKRKVRTIVWAIVGLVVPVIVLYGLSLLLVNARAVLGQIVVPVSLLISVFVGVEHSRRTREAVRVASAAGK